MGPARSLPGCVTEDEPLSLSVQSVPRVASCRTGEGICCPNKTTRAAVHVGGPRDRGAVRPGCHETGAPLGDGSQTTPLFWACSVLLRR